MKAISMRDFRLQGEKALEDVDFDKDLPVLTDREGMRFFLIPVNEEFVREQEDELRRVLALRSLAESQKIAHEIGLDLMTEEEIQAEVKAARKSISEKSKKKIS